MKLFDSLTAEQQALIKKHLELVIEANETTNLTRIDGIENGMILHVEDSLVGIDEVNSAPPGLYGDLGSGAGFPGIPLSIATGRKTVLVDSRQKKMKILDSIIDELDMSDQITTFAGRAELLSVKRPKSFTVLTARALAQLSVLLELASPLLSMHGMLVCYKAHVEEEELQHALSVKKKTGMRLVSQRSILLNDEYKRTIVTFEKVSKPKVKLPRREGEAQKNPL